MKNKTGRMRRSLHDLQQEYDNGHTAPLELLMKAWDGIKALPPDNEHSFFKLGGYHGEPFRGAGWSVGNNAWWGGYCNHGNVLFPTWHRVYLLKLEEALQSIPGCEAVMMPYWDQTNQESLSTGIPWALTDEFFPRGSQHPNPLRSFTFPVAIVDNINSDNPNYSKYQGYQTVRYPLSGLVGPNDRATSEKYNANFTEAKATEILNGNVILWLTQKVFVNDDPNKQRGLVEYQYEQCLLAPNYTVFSNTSSAQEYNNAAMNNNPKVATATPLESPHNSIHLALGGCDVTGYNADVNPIYYLANGDMGENDTAGLDPIFYFHHCNIDRMFWIWQKKHNATKSFDIIPAYPGTNSMDSQGPTAGVAAGSWLTMDSPLAPFRKANGTMYTSKDCIDIEDELGYSYTAGSMDMPAGTSFMATEAEPPSHTLRLGNINRAPIRGSFVITAHAIKDGKKQLLGVEAVLSRWGQKYCANCQTHQEIKAHFKLPESLIDLTPDDIEVGIHTHDGKMSNKRQQGTGLMATATLQLAKPVSIAIN